MLKSLLRKKEKQSVSSPLDEAWMPEGVRAYVIGDIHGRLDLLDQLLGLIDADEQQRDARETHLVFLGDLIDRGMQSAEVIERAMQLQQADSQHVHYLMGNHEEVFLGAARGDEKMVRFFCRIGGRETILSYGLGLEQYHAMTCEELSQWMLENVPREHVDFVSDFKDQVVLGDYAFVHAGIRPGIEMAEQKAKDLRWIRDDFLHDMEPHDKIIVHGHTITETVDECSNRIGIDTGAYFTGTLTALMLEDNRRHYLQTVGQDIDPEEEVDETIRPIDSTSRSFR